MSGGYVRTGGDAAGSAPAPCPSVAIRLHWWRSFHQKRHDVGLYRYQRSTTPGAGYKPCVDLSALPSALAPESPGGAALFRSECYAPEAGRPGVSMRRLQFPDLPALQCAQLRPGAHRTVAAVHRDRTPEGEVQLHLSDRGSGNDV